KQEQAVDNQKLHNGDTRKEAEDVATKSAEGLTILGKMHLQNDEAKRDNEEMKLAIEANGGIATDNKHYLRQQTDIALKDLDLRLQDPNLDAGKRKELKKERATLMKEQGTLLQKGLGRLSLGIAGLTEKFGSGAMKIGTTLLTLFGIGLLIKFLESDTWKRMREFLKSGSWEDFKEIFMPGGSFDGISAAILAAIGIVIARIALWTFKKLGGGLLLTAIKGVFSLLAKGLGKMKIPGFKPGQIFGKKPLGGGVDKATKGASKAASKKVPKGDTRPMREIIKDRQLGKPAKKPGRFSRWFGSAKKLGGAALEKGAQLGKSVVESGKKIGKESLSSAKAALPKIAGASKGALKAAAAAGKFIPGAGLIIGAGVAAVEGVAAGVEEFKESGDAGRAMAEGLGGVLSSLSFGLIDKDQIADLMVDAVPPKDKMTPDQLAQAKDKMTSDQLAQAMAGGPSVGSLQFASMAGQSDAARLRELQEQLREKKINPEQKGLSERALGSQIKALEMRMRGKRDRATPVNVINQDSSTTTNQQTTQAENIIIEDREMVGAVAAGPA
ncbi:uncharacterized protein METZ01_LOCUS198814, partial [marine metagenome]